MDVRTLLSSVALAGVMVVSLGLREAEAVPISVLIVESDGTAPQAELLASGFFSTVDVFNASAGTPTLGQLSSYDAVLAYTNNFPADPGGLGDVLQDYVDAGGGLVISTYAFSTPWAIQGGIMTTGYAPLVNLGANGNVGSSLVQTNPSAIFNGVDLTTLTFFQNGNFSHPGLDVGATLLAVSDGGFNMIAINAAQNIIGNNLYPGTCCGFNNGEFYELIANELVEVSGEAVSVPEPLTLALFGGGLAGLAMIRRRRKAKA